MKWVLAPPFYRCENWGNINVDIALTVKLLSQRRIVNLNMSHGWTSPSEIESRLSLKEKAAEAQNALAFRHTYKGFSCLVPMHDLTWSVVSMLRGSFSTQRWNDSGREHCHKKKKIFPRLSFLHVAFTFWIGYLWAPMGHRWAISLYPFHRKEKRHWRHNLVVYKGTWGNVIEGPRRGSPCLKMKINFNRVGCPPPSNALCPMPLGSGSGRAGASWGLTLQHGRGGGSGPSGKATKRGIQWPL